MKTKTRTAVAVREKTFRAQVIDPSIFFTDGIPNPDPMGRMVDAYQLHPWVYAAVFAISSNFAAIDYEVLKVQEDGSTVPDTKNPFTKILRMTNPFMTSLDLKEYTSISLEMTGNAYWGLERAENGMVTEAWPLPPHQVRAVSSPTAMIDHYIFEVNGRKINYAYDDIIHFQYTNPKDQILGQASVQAAKNILTTDIFAETWNKNFFKNSARPDAILESEKSLSTEVRKRILESWRSLHSGAAKSRKVAILEGGVKYSPTAHNHADMEFVEGRKLAREQILAVFGVPPSIVGVLEFANYANIKEQSRMFWMHTLLPKIRKFESTMTLRVQQITFNPNIIVKADLSTVESLRTDELARSQIAKNYWDMGVPFNTLIDSLNLPFEHIEGGDEPHPRVPMAAGGGFGWFPDDEGADKRLQYSKAVAQDRIKQNQITRIEHWKAFDRDTRGRMNKMEVSMRAFFNGQFRRIQSAFKKHADAIIGDRLSKQNNPAVNIDLIFDDDLENRSIGRSAGKHIKGTFFDFAVKTSKKLKPGFDFNLQDPKALHWIEQKKTRISREMNSATKESLSENIVEAIEEALAEGFSRSETIAQIADRIEDVHQFAAEHRAETIARTEIISASNKGSMEGMIASDVKKKEWLSSKDDLVRESHDQVDGQVVLITEKFLVGNSTLEFPGDPSGPPGETINCRCTVLPVIED